MVPLFHLFIDCVEPLRGCHLGQLGVGRKHKETETVEGARTERRNQGDASKTSAPLRKIPRPATNDQAAQSAIRFQSTKSILKIVIAIFRLPTLYVESLF